MNNPNPVATYALRLGDNGLVLAQRLGAWCGHAPELEIDLALANIGLDLLGQARNFLSYAAELNGCGDEDTLAFGRDERQYSNLLLVEQGIAVDPRELQAEWQSAVHTALLDSGLQIPQEAAFRSGGKQGLHSEHLGPLLAEMQYLQRSHPGLQW